MGLVRMLNRRFAGWSVWYGSATGRWWALAPRWGHGLVGLVEAGTPEELVLRMNRIEQSHPYAACDPPAEPPVPPNPLDRHRWAESHSADHVLTVLERSHHRRGSIPMIAMRPRALASALGGITAFLRRSPAPKDTSAQADAAQARTLSGPAALTGRPILSHRFAPSASQVKPARTFVADLLGDEHPCRYDAMLLTSELAANVVRHAAERDFLVSVAFPDAGVMVAVEDGGSSKVPHLRKPGNDETDGRGLALVDTLASRWGFERRPTGTLVWFELAQPSPDQLR
ncbi:ATP-binding protein [Sphaerisporangium sp. NPDC088356]|uniref:ATP-binding protein n=1 Tax=Sphaerisporangium sp. NPDC088356 TaxID=3154871 RepID=UPI00342DB040